MRFANVLPDNHSFPLHLDAQLTYIVHLQHRFIGPRVQGVYKQTSDLVLMLLCCHVLHVCKQINRSQRSTSGISVRHILYIPAEYCPPGPCVVHSDTHHIARTAAGSQLTLMAVQSQPLNLSWHQSTSPRTSNAVELLKRNPINQARIAWRDLKQHAHCKQQHNKC